LVRFVGAQVSRVLAADRGGHQVAVDGVVGVVPRGARVRQREQHDELCAGPDQGANPADQLVAVAATSYRSLTSTITVLVTRAR
jgi:hypothetical protein